jgi:hypothetical protein
MKERTHMFGPTCRPKSPNGKAHMFGPTCRHGYALEGKKGVEIRYRKWLLLDPLPGLHPYLNLNMKNQKASITCSCQLAIIGQDEAGLQNYGIFHPMYPCYAT